MQSITRTAFNPVTEADFRLRAQAGLLSAPQAAAIVFEGPIPGPSDFDLNPGAEAEFGLIPVPKPAAVLVPVIARDGGLTLLFTQRTEHLPAHAGQISFPGGKIDAGDGGPLEAALREAHEEIGLTSQHVEPLGYLDCYRTGTGYVITPVVALVALSFALSLNPIEVSSAFEVPLAFLMDAQNHRTDARVYRGRERLYYAMPYGEHYIWGATAGILKNMHERLFSP